MMKFPKNNRRGKGGLIPILSAFVIAVIVGEAAYLTFDLTRESPGVAAEQRETAQAGAQDKESARFGACAGPIRRNCVVDGDTFWYRGRKIRIADINTPELGSAQCDYERQLGERAKARLRVLLNQGNFTLETIDRDKDRYGRDLRIVTRGGESLGDILVAEGLAEEWQGYRRFWC